MIFVKSTQRLSDSMVWGTITAQSVNRQTEIHCYNAIISIYKSSNALDQWSHIN